MLKHFILLAFVILSAANCRDYDKLKRCAYKYIVPNISMLIGEVATEKLSLKAFVDAYIKLNMDATFKQMTDQCGFDQMFSELIRDGSGFLGKVGLSTLFATNCSKDIGIALLVLDTAIAQIKTHENIPAILVNVVGFAITSLQGERDCVAAYQNIREIWSKTK